MGVNGRAGIWESRIERLEGGCVQKVSLFRGAQQLCYREVARRWQSDEAFRIFFIGLLVDTPFDAYLWETPPVTARTIDRGFEFALVDSPRLASLPLDTSAFADYFARAVPDESTVGFANLGRDAFLVAPCPRSSPSVYPHLAAFARGAPSAEQHALWCSVGETLERLLCAQPLWLNTSGLGVAWVHIRFDSRPKYYSFAPYREARH